MSAPSPFSSSCCCLAPSIWRRLLMQAFIWETARARTKFGIAIAANRPMIATTIMISTRVKPDLREVLIFICSSFVVRGVNLAAGGLISSVVGLFTYCLLRPHGRQIAPPVPTPEKGSGGLETALKRQELAVSVSCVWHIRPFTRQKKPGSDLPGLKAWDSSPVTWFRTPAEAGACETEAAFGR